MRFPCLVSSRVPRGLHNVQQLCLFVRELESLRMRDFEALRQAETHGLLRKPVHSDPLAECSGGKVALVRKVVEAKRATARQIEVVKHLVHFHGAPLTRGLWCQTLDPLAILLPLLLREEETPIHLLQPQSPRDISDHCDS